MKKIIIFAALITSSIICAENIRLPQAAKTGGMSCREALNQRQTIRTFKTEKLTTQLLANMLWSANGVNRTNGKRTAPSAMDKREVMIYVALADGAYLYKPEEHILEKICDADLRSYCGRYEAPCYFILVPDRTRQPREIFAAVDTGYVSQNIYLAAAVNGLGTCAMGSVADPGKLAEKLKLDKNMPLLVHPVGIPQ